MTLDVTKPTDQTLASELASYIREDRVAINSVGGGTVTTVEEAFNVESAATVTTATAVNEATTVSEAVNVTNAAIVTNVDNIETNNGAITNVDVVASTPSVTAATTVTSATTVTAADNVESASEVTTATNIENAAAVQTADVENATTVTTGTTITNATTVTDAIAVTNADNVETATTINSITTLTQATSCTIEHADVVNEFGGVTATASEINTVCNGATATAAEINAACDGTFIELLIPFAMRRARFVSQGILNAYKLVLWDGLYYVKDKLAYWSDYITTAALGGSPSALTYYYLYLDYSAITAGVEITSSELIWSSTAPTYSEILHGWYNGDDLCIFACRANATPDNFIAFKHVGDLVVWDNPSPIWDASDITPSNVFTDVTCSGIPAFSTRALITVMGSYVNNGTMLYIRPNGSDGFLNAGHVPAIASATCIQQMVIDTDTSKKIEVKWGGGATTNTVSLTTDGWFFPHGM